MRLVLLSDTFYPNVGGAELVVHQLACTWAQQGHAVTVLTCSGDQSVTPGSPYRVVRLPFLKGSTRYGFHRTPFLQYSLLHLQPLLDALQPELVSAHFAYPAGIWMKALRRSYPYLVTLHGKDITPFEWGYRQLYGNIDGLLREALTGARGVIALSSYIRRELETLGVPSALIHEIPNGVQLERFSTPVEGSLRARLGLTEETPLVLSVGRHHPAKAYDVGLTAFEQLSRRCADAHWLVVGKGNESLGAQAQARGLAGKVHTLEHLGGADLVRAYQQADVLFSCSKSEVLSLVLLEGMAAGCAVVATRISGAEDVVLEDQTGYLVEVGHTTQMAARLEQVLTEPGRRTRLRAGARQRIQAYGWDQIARRYLSLA